LSGIEYFENLDTLICGYQKLKKVNLNKNINLQYLNLSGNDGLEAIQIDSLSLLSHLEITNIGYEFDSINLSHFKYLKELFIDNLNSLDVSNNPELKILSAIRIPDIDVSQNLKLKRLTCSNQTNVDLSNNALLESLSCIAYGSDTTDGLMFLDVTKNLLLKELDCQQNNLTQLDLSHNTELETLICSTNPIKKIDLSSNTKLKIFRCQNCKLDSLDVSNNRELNYLNCHFNQIKKLNITNNKNLEILVCPSNQIDSLNLANCQNLKKLDCSNNNLGFLDLSKNNQLEWIQIIENPNLKNVCVWELPFPPSGVWLNDWGCPELNYVNCNTSVTQINKPDIRIFPNPTDGDLYIDLPFPQKVNSISLTNLAGKIIFQKEYFNENNLCKLDLKRLKNGVYIITVNTVNGLYNERIIKKSSM
jgi:Leucine-rich repeat (LRR) protein